MKKLLCSALFVLSLVCANAQKLYFVYIESAQPFFIKLDERTYSSGNKGYVILSPMADSNYRFRIGFPQNRYPDQLFSLALNGSDHGFELRNSGDADWGLFDLQSQKLIPAAKMVSAFRTEPRNISAFTEILSRATDDPSLRFTMTRIGAETAVPPLTEKAAASAPVLQQDSVGRPREEGRTVLQSDSAGSDLSVAQMPPVKEAATPTANPTPRVLPGDDTSPVDTTGRLWDGLGGKAGSSVTGRSVITKRSESSTTAGFGLTFTDEYNGRRDTITIIIPNAPSQVRLGAGSADQGAVATAVNCKSVATDGEVTRVLRKLRSMSRESAMLDEAGKLVRSKCVTTEQARTLAAPFPGDGGKTKLFELLYPKSADPASFASLEKELNDEYFINRFRALLR